MQCSNVNTLPDVIFIGGGEQYFEYTIYNSETGELVDISDISFQLLLNSMTSNNEFNTITLDGIKKNSNTFQVVIPSEITENIRGVYIQQPVLIDYMGKRLKPSQGIVTITQSAN